MGLASLLAKKCSWFFSVLVMEHMSLVFASKCSIVRRKDVFRMLFLTPFRDAVVKTGLDVDLLLWCTLSNKRWRLVAI